MFSGEGLIGLILTYRYAILLPLACLEGPILALAVGFLVKLGYFSAIPAYLLMCAGDFFPDIFYYWVGHFGNKYKFLEKYALRLQFATKNFPIIEKLWHEHSFKMMFLSKLAYGLSTPLLFSAGLAKMNFKKFVFLAFPITLFQYAIILMLGYYLGSYYELATKYIKSAGLFFAVIVIIFIAIYISIQKFARRQVEIMEKEELS